MKKITLITFLAMISAIVVNAQNVKTFTGLDQVAAQKQGMSISKDVMHKLDARTANTSKATSEKWLYNRAAVDNLYGGNWDGYAIGMFPDTTMYNTYDDGTTSLMFFHSFAVTVDPFGEIYNDDPASSWTAAGTSPGDLVYTLDSILIPGYYVRNTAASIHDTIVIQITEDKWGYSLDASQYSWVYTNFGVQQMNVPAVLHDEGTWMATSADAAVIQTIKVPLTEADSTVNGDFVVDYGFATPLEFTGDGFNMSVTFVPGYAYTPLQDTINNFNKFSFWTYEQNTDAFPPYLEDRNCSHGMNVWHYRDQTRDAYSPHYLFDDAGYALEYHDVRVKLTATNVGIETAEQGALTVSQNRPNPFNGTTTIDYSLVNSANVMVEVYNVAGAKVMTVNEGEKAAGQYTMTIDGSQLDAGVYYYTFTADNNKVTKKMIVY